MSSITYGWPLVIAVLMSVRGLLSTPHDEQQVTKTVPSREVVLAIDNQHTIIQNNRCTALRDCSSLIGADLYECMRYVTPDNFKSSLAALNPRARYAYITMLSIAELREVRSFFTPEEWHAFCLNDARVSAYLTQRLAQQSSALPGFFSCLISALLCLLCGCG